MNLYAVEPASRANGPGLRFVVWFQGCSRGCRGCFNPDTHPIEPRNITTPEDLLERIEAVQRQIDGVTITGGEPFEQAEGLLAFARGLRRRTELSLLVFSGYTIEQVRAMPLGDEILACTDVLIDGPFRPGEACGETLRGSANQRIHLLTDRYSLKQFADAPTAEILIAPSGRIRITGIDPPESSPPRPTGGAPAAISPGASWVGSESPTDTG